ncbi:MAG: FAD:protein FMN transferase [Flavobacteriaceae bacterium]
MGSRFEITVVAPNTEMGYINIEEAAAEIKRIEKMISSWDSHSQTSQINTSAGLEPVKVSPELFALVERCLRISQVTDGAFDISYASMDRIWKFDGSMQHLPTKKEVEESISRIGYQNIVLDKEQQTVFLKKKGMRIGFGAIGKGYAADKAKSLLISKGVKSGIINASGDLTTWGTKLNGDKWMVGIANPLRKDKVFSWLPIVESSVATSGSYEKYVELNGKKYSHIIDPRTGYPVSGIQSVSVFAKEAEMCDALATAVFIMGRETGIGLIEQLGGVEVIVVDDNNKIHKSKGITFQSY